MKEIHLSLQGKNKGKYSALVDDEDYEFLSQFRWSVRVRNHTCYATTRIIGEGLKSTIISMHTMILGEKDGCVIDHIDHNGLNCKKKNLRFATPSENSKNRVPIVGGHSKYLGVTLKPAVWYVRIYVDGKNKYIGTYYDEIDAAKAYDKAAKEHYGEFANLNFK